MKETASIRSPFKFLDPYDKEDRSIFFGREKEIEALYGEAKDRFPFPSAPDPGFRRWHV